MRFTLALFPALGLAGILHGVQLMDLRPRSVLVGFASGLGAAVVLPFVAPVVAEIVRPLAKTLLKQGMLGFERLRTAGARGLEGLEDLLAEVRMEVESELKASAPEPEPLVVPSGSPPVKKVVPGAGNGARKNPS